MQKARERAPERSRRRKPWEIDRRYASPRSGRKNHFQITFVYWGTIWFTELHWYEAHGIGKKKIKIKRYLSKARAQR